MAILSSILSIACSLLLTPIIFTVLCIIFLASIGKSLGVRRLYIKVLLMIFEYGRRDIEIADRKKRIQSPVYEEDDDDDDEDDTTQTDGTKLLPDNAGDDGGGKIKSRRSSMANGHANGSSHVINRDDHLILVPNPPVQNDSSILLQKRNSDCKNILDFQLSNCLDLVKAGVEAIIEDEVTSRFEAEELKNWNLLTRTNRRYEFISWKLTVIWAGGFFVRYFFLFPLRLCIFGFGFLWVMSVTTLLGFIPDGTVKRWLSNRFMLMTNRIQMRPFSAVLNFHNIQYRPKNSGICVANHTTIVDAILLSTETTFCMVIWLTICTALVGYIPDGRIKTNANYYVSISCFGILSSVLSAKFQYNNPENRPRNGICVANHTSPIDVLVLMCDNCYSLIGQRHGGFLGILQRALARASPHIWFERSEVKDRHAVANRLKEHVSNPNNPPILIFPEGTCINNTSVMQFKKGSFEVDSVIYPVAIKYDPRFGDAFWNSSKYSMMQYLFMMMTSWAIVCDVWYLPPMHRRENESAIDFANRVKSVIAKQGGLVDLVWDGQLKRVKPKKEWREQQQQEFSRRLKLE